MNSFVLLTLYLAIAVLVYTSMVLQSAVWSTMNAPVFKDRLKELFNSLILRGIKKRNKNHVLAFDIAMIVFLVDLIILFI